MFLRRRQLFNKNKAENVVFGHFLENILAPLGTQLHRYKTYRFLHCFYFFDILGSW